MRNTAFRAAAVLALAASAQLQAAQVEASTCLNRGEVRGMIAYFLPTVLQSTLDTCAQQLPSDSYLLGQGPRLVSTLESGRAAAWPQAKQAFIKLGAKNDKDSIELFSALPETAIRPLVEGVITQKLAPSIKPGSCKDIDRIMAPLAPLPTANLIETLSEVMVVAGRKSKDMPVCPDA